MVAVDPAVLDEVADGVLHAYAESITGSDVRRLLEGGEWAEGLTDQEYEAATDAIAARISNNEYTVDW